MWRALFLIVGGILVLDTCCASCACSPNLGVFLPALIGFPPVLIGLLWNFLKPFWSTNAGRILRWILIGGYSVFGLTFAFCCARIAGYAVKTPEPGADVVLVLGAAVRGDVPSTTLASRLDTAADYLEENPETCVIVTGGKGRGENISEAEAMKRNLEARGIDSERIYTEDQSTSTLENLRNAKEILDREFSDAQRVILVSSDYHLYRAVLTAKKLGLEVEALGSRSTIWLRPNFYLREYVALTGYFLLGRLG